MGHAQKVEEIDSDSRRVLDYLIQARLSPFTSENTPISVRILAQDLGMGEPEINRICLQLARCGSVQKIKAGGRYPYYRIP